VRIAVVHGGVPRTTEVRVALRVDAGTQRAFRVFALQFLLACLELVSVWENGHSGGRCARRCIRL